MPKFEDFISCLEETPRVHTVDAVPSLISCNYPSTPLNQVLLTARSGVLWLIDFSERVVLRISSSHANGRPINTVRYFATGAQ